MFGYQRLTALFETIVIQSDNYDLPHYAYMSPVWLPEPGGRDKAKVTVTLIQYHIKEADAVLLGIFRWASSYILDNK